MSEIVSKFKSSIDQPKSIDELVEGVKEDKITLLTGEQVEILKVFRKYGKQAKTTDLCGLQYGYICDEYCEYWTKTPYSGSSYVWYVDYLGFVCISGYGDDASSQFGIRPVIPLSKIYQFKECPNIKKINGIEEIEFGEYPQSIVDEKLDKKLENLYQENKLLKTEKKYTVMFGGKKYGYPEFFYNSDKYVRVVNFCDSNINVKKGKAYWLKVEPIKWLVNRSILKNNNIAISKNILAAMPFSYSNNNDYEKSDIKEFLEKYFVKEIVPSKVIISNEEKKRIMQRKLLEKKLEKSQRVHDDVIKREEKTAKEVKILEEERIKKEEERQQEIKDIEDDLISNFKILNMKYNKLLELDSNKEIKHPHISIEKDILCDYNIEDKCYKIKDKFIPYLSYIQFSYDMKDVDVRGLDLSDSIVNISGVYKKSLEGCNLNGNKYVLNEVNAFDGYNLNDASVYSDTVLFLRGAYINSKTIESINKKYISEALDGAILEKDAIEFLNSHREEYGINKSINVKVIDGEKIEDIILFDEFNNCAENNKYYEVINQFERNGFSTEDVENILNIMKEKRKVQERRKKYV